jgi:hypothetical protein
MNIKTFAISSDLFSYYEKEINVDLVNSIDEIILLVVSELDKLFRENNLIMLSEKLNDCKFHVHDFTIEEVKNSINDRKYYICDHCE